MIYTILSLQILVSLNMICMSMVLQDFFLDPSLIQIVGPIIFFLPTAASMLPANMALVFEGDELWWPLIVYWIPTVP